VLPGFPIDIVDLGTQLRLTWEPTEGPYEVWFSTNDPYFDPGAPQTYRYVVDEPAAEVSAYGSQRFFMVVDANGDWSRRVGSFQHELTPGFNKISQPLIPLFSGVRELRGAFENTESPTVNSPALFGWRGSSTPRDYSEALSGPAYVWDAEDQRYRAARSGFNPELRTGMCPILRSRGPANTWRTRLVGYVPDFGDSQMLLYPGHNYVTLPLWYGDMQASDLLDVLPEDAAVADFNASGPGTPLTQDGGDDFLIEAGTCLVVSLTEHADWPPPQEMCPDGCELPPDTEMRGRLSLSGATGCVLDDVSELHCWGHFDGVGESLPMFRLGARAQYEEVIIGANHYNCDGSVCVGSVEETPSYISERGPTVFGFVDESSEIYAGSYGGVMRLSPNNRRPDAGWVANFTEFESSSYREGALRLSEIPGDEVNNTADDNHTLTLHVMFNGYPPMPFETIDEFWDSGLAFLPSREIAVASDHWCSVTEGGYVTCAGVNVDGQISASPLAVSHYPVLPPPHFQHPDLRDLPYTDAHYIVPDMVNAVEVAVGPRRTCAVDSEGDVYCWGSGMLGADEVEVHRQLVTRVEGLADEFIVDIVSTYGEHDGDGGHNCVLTEDGTAYCWGSNAYGQVGCGQTGDQMPFPLPVVGPGGEGMLTGIVDLAVTSGRSCAVLEDGATYCWGRMNGGSEVAPVPVEGLQNAATVRLGDLESCALTHAGALFCWPDGGVPTLREFAP
jgi:hypothetical protein